MTSESTLLRLLVLPAIKFCLKRSMGVYDLLEVVKAAFVEVASEELTRTEERISVSRISVMTGVHRRDVRRLMDASGEEVGSKHLVTRVLGLWEQGYDFTTKSGKPKPLTCIGDDSEFVKLVRTVSTDVNPVTVLSELVRIGTVKREDGKIKLVRAVDTYGEELGPEKALSILARDMESLIDSVEQNMEGEHEVGNLHIRTEYDRVYRKDIPKIRRWLRKQGNSFHHSVRGFVSKCDEDINPKAGEKGEERVVTVSFSWTTTGNEAEKTERLREED